ncbi:MAG TPA: AI-2E family transporter [Acidimicrobiales bacterium]|nr:AI-2E family transporter [Acidimicrobiales bacterium]
MTNESSSERDAPDTRRSRIFVRAEANNVPLRTILVTVFVVAGVYLAALVLYRLRNILLIMLVGGFVALLLNPLVDALQRWRIPRRGVAVFIVTLVATMIFVALAVAFGYPLVNSTTHLANALPAYVSKAEHGRGWIGHLLSHYHIKNWLRNNSAKLVSFANGLSKPALALGRGAVTVLLTLFTMFVFVILLLVEGPTIGRSLLSTMSPAREAWVTRVARKVSQATFGYMLGNLLTSIMAGVVVFVTLWSLSVPFAFLGALWVALVDFLPQIGGALAGIPTIAFALVHSTSAGIITAMVFLLYTTVENHVLNPVIMSRTVRINPLAVFFAILVGAELGAWIDGIFGGFVGVLLAVPSAATIHVIFREIWNSTHPRAEAIDTNDRGEPAST